ncbi:unnamed protein product [Brassica rapa subsp. narinosa]
MRFPQVACFCLRRGVCCELSIWTRGSREGLGFELLSVGGMQDSSELDHHRCYCVLRRCGNRLS